MARANRLRHGLKAIAFTVVAASPIPHAAVAGADGTGTDSFAKGRQASPTPTPTVTPTVTPLFPNSPLLPPGGDGGSKDVPPVRFSPRAIDLVPVPAGPFTMGRVTQGDDAASTFTDEIPQHTVSLAAFSIGTREVTNAEFADCLNWALANGQLQNSSGGAFTTGNPYKNQKMLIALSDAACDVQFSGGTFSVRTRSTTTSGSIPMDDHPVHNVTWYGAVAYCNFSSQREGKPLAYSFSTWDLVDADGGTPGLQFAHGYRLPTEAEWERAAAWEPPTPTPAPPPRAQARSAPTSVVATSPRARNFFEAGEVELGHDDRPALTGMQLLAPARSAAATTPEIPAFSEVDADGNAVDDRLDMKAFAYQAALAAAGEAPPEDEPVSVEVVFSKPVEQSQIEEFLALGGEITWIYKAVSYGWNGRVPVSRLQEVPVAMGKGLVGVHGVFPITAHLANATRNARVRPGLWNTGADGDPNITIAIVDSGVDDSHTDLAGRSTYWKDYTPDNSANPVGVGSHGTHVASIALGTGAASGLNPTAIKFTNGNRLLTSGFWPAIFEIPASVTSYKWDTRIAFTAQTLRPSPLLPEGDVSTHDGAPHEQGVAPPPSCIDEHGKGSAPLAATPDKPSPDGSWQFLPAEPAAARAAEPWIRPQKSSLFRLNEQSLKDLLASAPDENALAAATPPVLWLPRPDGGYERFEAIESPIWEPGFEKNLPGVMTYRGQGIDDPTANVRFDWTYQGFHASVLSAHGAYMVDPWSRGDTELYSSYYRRDYLPAQTDWECHVKEVAEALPDLPSTPGLLVANGVTKRQFRIAVAGTGEYTTFVSAPSAATAALGQAAIVTAINRVNQVYETDLSVRLNLVANNINLVYTVAGTDPYTNNNSNLLLSENQTNVDAVIGTANYDIGHVFSTAGGGLAALGVVCNNTQKARGETGTSSPTGDAFWIDYVAHEIGHQFKANHTFNSSAGSCSGNRNASTAVEIGSGSTILAYAGICSTDDLQPHTDPYFSQASLNEIVAFLGTQACSSNSATNNNLPTVTTGISYTIPKGTPFTVSATGTDLDCDGLTYCWEENDLGVTQALTAADNGTSPIFRSYNPTTEPSRTFPRLSDIISNTVTNFEKYPAVNRAMKLRCYVRDNKSGGGGIGSVDRTLNVVAAAGPFVVTAPNGGENVTTTTLVVTWNVAGTTANGVNTANVNIKLSTDGGSTFPVTLAGPVPNNGSASVTLPSLTTANARVKVEAVGNVYWDMSNGNFSINAGASAGVSDSHVVVTNGGTLQISEAAATSATSPLTRTGATQANPGAPTGLLRLYTDYALAQAPAVAGGLYASSSTITAQAGNFGVSDSYNLYRGVAPTCSWAGGKVFRDDGSGCSAYIGSALDDMVVQRSSKNIKVLNMSLGLTGSGATDTSLRSKTNTAVNQGIVVCVSMGNAGPTGEVSDPGRAGNAITVAASNFTNQLTQYTSIWQDIPDPATEDYKPDLTAPGGSLQYTAPQMIAADSNDSDADGSDGQHINDQIANDYTMKSGTSMASPIVAGAAALLIDAWQQTGHAWSFGTGDDPLFVKMMLCATATETNQSREGGSNSPLLDRAKNNPFTLTNKDRFEGYGMLNPDAAIDALKTQYVSPTAFLLANQVSTPFQRRAFGRYIELVSGVPIALGITGVAGGDFDLYLYDSIPGPQGHPVILASSTLAGKNVSESIMYTPSVTRRGYLVVKAVSGIGTCTISDLTPGKHWIYGMKSDTLTGNDRANYYSGSAFVNPMGLNAIPNTFTSPSGWFNGSNTSPNGNVTTVDSPSPVGAYDMTGNLAEWCHDWYGSGYYSSGSPNNPTGPTTGTTRVTRGGNWGSVNKYARTAYRHDPLAPTVGSSNKTGFRVALTP